jgi:hypothetical protein
MHRRGEKRVQFLVRKQKGRDHWEDLGVDKRIYEMDFNPFISSDKVSSWVVWL